jgi:hypothetical protein
MKKLALILSLIASTNSAFAAQKTDSERILFAVNILTTIAEQSSEYNVAPNADAKKMLQELAVVTGETPAEDFDSYWTTDDYEMWEADAMAWGETDSEGAKGYFEGVLDTNLSESEKTTEDKIRYADGKIQMERAFSVLNDIRTVKYGVAPMGAVQCGVTFPSLMILDTTSGKVYQLIMEGSGC